MTEKNLREEIDLANEKAIKLTRELPQDNNNGLVPHITQTTDTHTKKLWI